MSLKDTSTSHGNKNIVRHMTPSDSQIRIQNVESISGAEDGMLIYYF